MSVTIYNQASWNHVKARIEAMNQFPIGHPGRRAMWEEFNVEVVGGADYHMSEWAFVPIWKALKANGWETTLFPCSGAKRLTLITALEKLLDQAVDEPVIPELALGEALVYFNQQGVYEALQGFIAFLKRNEEVYSI